MSKRVLITGAAQGLGASLAKAFTDRGDRVLATDRAGTEVVLDVTSQADWQAVRDRVNRDWGGLDILVNNAGIASGGRLDLDTIEEWQQALDVNLLGAVRGIKTFYPMFKSQRSGHIVNIASLAGLVHPAGLASYNAAKAAVVALTETVGYELSGWGVRASVVCPSYFRTGLLDSAKGMDVAVGRVVSRLIRDAKHSPDEIAAQILLGIERGDEVILPDDDARVAVELKRDDRVAYDSLMRGQARKLEAGIEALDVEG